MATVSWWEFMRDLVIICVLLVGYAWLAVLTKRVRVLSRRLGSHVCREPDAGRAGHRESDGRVEVAEILRRERDTPRPMLPRARGAPATAEVTEPMPVVRDR
jgi:hypothetical protein